MTDLRCPRDTRALLGKILASGGRVVDGNLVEIACDPCKRTARREGRRVKDVLHRCNPLGDCVETVVVPAP